MKEAKSLIAAPSWLQTLSTETSGVFGLALSVSAGPWLYDVRKSTIPTRVWDP